MNIYFAVAVFRYVQKLKACGVKKILISFADEKMCRRVIDAKLIEYDDKVIIDSGAFSAWTLGKKIDLQKYIHFCKWVISKNVCREIYFVNLDIIPARFGRKPTKEEVEDSAVRGLENYRTMKKQGLNVIPVFHQHEDFKWLLKMMKETHYIGISPANDVSIKQKLKWLKKVFSIVKSDYNTHLFGMTASSILKIIPTYSADSTSWMSSALYGTVIKYTSDLKTKSGKIQNKRFVVDAGMTVEEIGDYKARMGRDIKNVLGLENNLSRLWEKRGIKWSDNI